jgi:hypothetical protein
MVPETLLKKRKSQEAARAEARAAAEEKKKVSVSPFQHTQITPNYLMITANHATRPSGRCCRIVNHLSGLTTVGSHTIYITPTLF